VQIHELTFASKDPAGQGRFWAGEAGATGEHGAEEAVEVSLRAPTIRFERAPAGADARYHFAINVPRGSIHDAAAWIADRHELLAFHGDPDEEEGATIVHTRSRRARPLLPGRWRKCGQVDREPSPRNDSHAPFGPNSFLEIAEVGLATADTHGTRAALLDVLSAPILWDGREGWLLTAIGDDPWCRDRGTNGSWLGPGRPSGEGLPTTIVAAGPKPADVTLPEGPYRVRVAAVSNGGACSRVHPAGAHCVRR
jgi:hypothetical protein